MRCLAEVQAIFGYFYIFFSSDLTAMSENSNLKMAHILHWPMKEADNLVLSNF